MARYKVLRSAAHNYAASFISVMNMSRDDYTMCHLVRVARLTGVPELRVNLLTGVAEPEELLILPVADSVRDYWQNFGGHVQRSGAALDMISRAELSLNITWRRELGRPAPQPNLHARLACEVRLVDDRGKEHLGRVQENWVCHPTKGFY